MNLNPITKIAAYWHDLTPGQQLFRGALGAAALTGVGTYAAGRRDSVPAQTLAYGSVFGVLGSTVAAGAGLLVMHSVRGDVAKLVAGGLDAAEGAKMIAAASHRALLPAKVMFGGSAFLAIGVAAGNAVVARTQHDVLERVTEAENQTRRASKTPSK